MILNKYNTDLGLYIKFDMNLYLINLGNYQEMSVLWKHLNNIDCELYSVN